MSGDLATMPTSPMRFGNFIAFSAATGGSSGGRVVMRVARRLVASPPRGDNVVLERGMAHMLRLSRAGTEEGRCCLALVASFDRRCGVSNVGLRLASNDRE